MVKQSFLLDNGYYDNMVFYNTAYFLQKSI